MRWHETMAWHLWFFMREPFFFLVASAHIDSRHCFQTVPYARFRLESDFPHSVWFLDESTPFHLSQQHTSKENWQRRRGGGWRGSASITSRRDTKSGLCTLPGKGSGDYHLPLVPRATVTSNTQENRQICTPVLLDNCNFLLFTF
jgi:hypothetical protein